MAQTILIVIGVAIVILLLTRRGRAEISGIGEYTRELIINKNSNKQKLLEFLKTRSPASNEDIRQALGVSSRSTVRYLNELEREGRVVQVGVIGQAVTYRLK
jgi:predicted HTH transcriptional regulator